VSVGLGRLQVFAAAVLFSTGGAGIKAAAFTGLQVSALRSGIAALILFALLCGLSRRPSTPLGTALSQSKGRSDGPKADRLVPSPAMLATGVVYAATVTLFVLSTKLTTAANAIFLQATAPLYLLLLAPLILSERFRARDMAFFVFVAAGLVLCVIGQPVPTTTAPDPTTGNMLAVICSITWALTLLGLRYVQREHADTRVGLSAVALGNLFASLAAWPFAWPLPAASAAEWATIAYLGAGQIGLAYVLLTAAIRVLPALEVSLLLLIEPVLNPIWTWLIRGEDPGAYTIAGGAIIVAATAIKSVYEERKTLAPETTKTV
jgi:drug/metabolite transporter (DMT)-like permease